MSAEPHSLSPSPAFPDSAAATARDGRMDVPLGVTIVDEGAADRAVAECFIHDHFAHCYGADVRHFLPRLMTLSDGHQQLLAALGFRRARTHALFLEHYLDAPVESVLSARLGGATARAGIVEVGNLAVARPGGARWLIAALTAYLKGAGYDWAVFTAVSSLRNSFARMGVELVILAAADKSRLPATEQGSWGRYYDTAPMVVAAGVHQSFEALTSHLGLDQDRYRLRPMWESAYTTGARWC